MFHQVGKNKCALCCEEPVYVFGIKLKAKSVCCSCANAIMLQNVQYLANQDMRGEEIRE